MTYLELGFDITCNAACVGCSSELSTGWQEFEQGHGLKDHGRRVSKKFRSHQAADCQTRVSDKSTDQGDVLLAQIKSQLSIMNLKKIFILGGEPFYSRSHLPLLRWLSDTHPDLGQVVLKYQSNGSIYPNKETLEHWKKFKHIEYGVSIDGVGQRFDYLRWPLKWDQVSHNVIRLANQVPIKLFVNSVASPFSALYWEEINQWLWHNFGHSGVLKPGANPRTQPGHDWLHLKYASTQLRLLIFKKYSTDHVVRRLVKQAGYESDLRPMLDYFHGMDKLRNLDWRRVFPEVSSCYPVI